MPKNTRLAQYDPNQELDPNLFLDPASQEAINQAVMEQAPAEAVAPNGVPQAVVSNQQQSMAPQDQLLQMINSPEYKAKMAELEGRAKKSIEEQRAGVGQNETSLKQMEQQAALQPLAALADTWYGGNLQKSLPSAEQVQMMKNQLQAQRKGLSDEEIALLKSQLGNMSPMNQLKAMSTMEYQQRYKQGGPVQQLAEFRTAQGARDKVLQRLSTNKDLGARLNAYQTLDNALSNMAAGKVRTPQQLVDFQDAIIAGLGMARGQSGVTERAERRFGTLDLNAAKFKQFLTSSPQDVLKNKALIGHLQDLARQEQVNVKDQFKRKLNAVGSGYGRLLQKYPDIQADLGDALSAYAGQFESPQIPDITKLKKGQQIHVGSKPKPFAPQPEVVSPAAGAPAIGTIEAGHRFIGGDPADPNNWEAVE